ncbi:hypothetical protein N7517_006367 [Penicillium concentricum]|uniref:Uncharacterized protein n=1 Tax=Penicillium concentricum TaxID=293559 RepID=A0A9W9S933_9EURO|nr:uncharacterized protein N7517_006367 [Penicillium concentricum]KAJ5374361.1 hypothetical protein N7517_006367 [Penicillium concentricum]
MGSDHHLEIGDKVLQLLEAMQNLVAEPIRVDSPFAKGSPRAWQQGWPVRQELYPHGERFETRPGGSMD